MRRSFTLVVAIFATMALSGHVGGGALALVVDVVAGCDDDACSSEPGSSDTCPPGCGSCADCACCVSVLGRAENHSPCVSRAPTSGGGFVIQGAAAPSSPDPRQPLRVPRSA